MIRFSLLSLLFSLTCALVAQTAEKRVALVVGNAKYANNPLTNPANDAREVAAALRSAGFAVTEKYDRDYDQLNNLLTEFSRSIKDPNTVALFYYAGHGVQHSGQNYLVPIGADNVADESEIEWRCVPLERVTSKMQDASNRLNIIVLDACRSFPVARGTRKLQNGLAQTGGSVPELLIAYATAPGGVADDRSDGTNGLFTASLLRQLRTPGYDLHKVFLETRKDVKQRTNGKQVPGVTDNVTVDFYFFPPLPPKPQEPVQSESEAAKPPEKKPTVTPPTQPAAATDEAPANCAYCPQMVFVSGTASLPNGKFRMGRETEDTEGGTDEQPAHSVAVPDFYLGKYEVTNREFCAFLNEMTAKLTFETNGDGVNLDGKKIFEMYCGTKLGECKGFTEMIEYDNGHIAGGEFTIKKGYENYAAAMVTWHGATAYATWLSGKTGLRYRLPTESEWEYAARGGAKSQGYKYSGSNNADEVAWHIGNAKGKKQFAVGQKKANELLLHDMSGSLWEWCEDCYHDTYAGHPRDGSAWVESNCSSRVVRGGSWSSSTRNARVAVRVRLGPVGSGNNFGFRLARTK